MLTTPCSEICYELGTYFLAQKDLNEAVIWFYNAAYETESILDVHTSGDLPLYGLVECYELLLAEAKSNIPSDTMLVSSYDKIYIHFHTRKTLHLPSFINDADTAFFGYFHILIFNHPAIHSIL